MASSAKSYFTRAVLASFVGLAATLASAAELNKKVQLAEDKRVAVIAKVKPSVVAVFGKGGRGGGSGVLISEDGYALTNFHVTAGAGRVMKCGLPDGILYDAVVVGEDKVGDVALIKLLPKKEGNKFPFAPLGDSDKVKAGDWSLAMGNPFLLATDFTPTVTFGLISGVHRYQYPSGSGLLEYTDCIQIDTSINPGNSGGPLFNTDGELIGINGRGSFQKRNRINSGVGYAISINQIKNFLGHLRAGLSVDHASLGAFIRTSSDDGTTAKITVEDMIQSDAARRGLEIDDELVTFGGRYMGSVNQFKNTLGLYPRGWRVPLSYRREQKKRKMLVRLMGAIPRAISDPPPGGAPKPPSRPQPIPDGPAKKLYVAKEGYANYYFNKLERDRLWKAFTTKHGAYDKLKGEWTITGKGTSKGDSTTLNLKITEVGTKTNVAMELNSVDYDLNPYGTDINKTKLMLPSGSGGLVAALFHYRRFLTVGAEKFDAREETKHGGYEPFYPTLPHLDATADYLKAQEMTEVLHTRHASVSTKWHFSLKDQTLLGMEVWVDQDEDPCEVFFKDYKKVGDHLLPTTLEVFNGNETFCVIKDLKFTMQAPK